MATIEGKVCPACGGMVEVGFLLSGRYIWWLRGRRGRLARAMAMMGLGAEVLVSGWIPPVSLSGRRCTRCRVIWLQY